ncbi:ABC transporter A family member 7 [Acorus calamus]|uniref:ABC transporter A family member 7 n=1 Tax=Acorus calamus TaxID=4465 RepID=A0AAV9DD29_ACOCL|nr:ABC transporter A family member 7 [Acorus calamus]
MRTNIGLVIFPAVFCLMLYGIQRMVDSVFTATSTDTCECNCAHMPPANRTTCEFSCEMKYLKMGRGQKMPCPVPNPTRWPSLVQLPETGNRWCTVCARFAFMAKQFFGNEEGSCFFWFLEAILVYLVYEKQGNLRIMMKVHGLNDGWKDIMLNSENYAMRDVLILMTAEWLILLVVAYYLDQSEIVEKLLMEPNENYHVICHNPRKVYQGRDGNPDKVAVEGLSLALARGECFGLMASTSGTTYVQGLDISKDMDEVYTSMGAIAESLKKVNLHDKEVADKLAGAYSGGMKRRLSVAISLIGNPHVCRS